MIYSVARSQITRFSETETLSSLLFLSLSRSFFFSSFYHLTFIPAISIRRRPTSLGPISWNNTGEMETAKLSLVHVGEREGSILPLCRVRVARKPAEPRLPFSPPPRRLGENCSRCSRGRRISHDFGGKRRKLGGRCRIVTVGSRDAHSSRS